MKRQRDGLPSTLAIVQNVSDSAFVKLSFEVATARPNGSTQYSLVVRREGGRGANDGRLFTIL